MFPGFHHSQQNHASEHPTQQKGKKTERWTHTSKDPLREKETKLQRTAHHHFNNPLVQQLFTTI
jgi:hypothetical protein